MLMYVDADCWVLVVIVVGVGVAWGNGCTYGCLEMI